MTLTMVKARNVKRSEHWKMLIYAKAGTGKTSLIRYLKGKTLVFDLDNSSRVLAGMDNVDIVPLDRNEPMENMEEFISNIRGIINKHHYENIVIDNLSSFERDWFTERALATKSGLNNAINDYSAWNNYLNLLTQHLLSINDVNILLTAWEGTREVTAQNGQSYTQYVPNLRDKVVDGVMGLTDLVGRLVVSTKEGTAGKRFVIAQGNDAVFAKNRIDDRVYMPAEELFTFDDTKPDGTQNDAEDEKQPEKEESKGDN